MKNYLLLWLRRRAGSGVEAAEPKGETQRWFSALLAVFINISGEERVYLPQTV